MTIVTRFAPSPTGFLHIGSARTALFNYLFAKHHNGKYLLRIEDTDLTRSTKEAVDAIINGLNWLGIEHDGEIVFQSKNIERHKQVAAQLVERGKAYYCYHSKAELEQMREEALKTGKPIKSKWRHANEAPIAGVDPVVRLKTPDNTEIIVDDLVQGRVVTNSDFVDDQVILRSDGTPTYMLAVVVDDHDMGVTHIIRGDDHLTNTPKQILIYQALDWDVPKFAHIPLIHGEDGAKLSKRHGAIGVEAYKEMGYLPEALCNYLLRLGWSHGNDEIIPANKAIEWFNLESIGKSPSRMDFKKMDNINAHYIKEKSDDELCTLIGFDVKAALPLIKTRVVNLNQLKEMAEIFKPEALIQPKTEFDKNLVQEFIASLNDIEWSKDNLLSKAKEFCTAKAIGLKDISSPLRIAITGSDDSPSIYEVMSILGKDEVSRRVAK